jgi:cob(I)alamin adenosyltransferase
MVKLNKIYTKTGDDGTTALAYGARRRKDDVRVESYGAVDEANSALGLARLYADKEFDITLARIQNELFDLGADLSTPAVDSDLPYEPLRIVPSQVTALEKDIDRLNAQLSSLNSFILPAGTALSAHLHLARTIVRRAERLMVTLKAAEPMLVSNEALAYVNRLSDFLFVAARFANIEQGDVLWVPGKTR